MSSSIQGYSIPGYGDMIVDRQRLDPYVQALKAAIKPGAVVLDIGTGTGFFAVLACQFGASKVYAIEPDDAISVARQVAIDNHCADKIEFIQALSTDIDLPERVDVIISDLRGITPIYQHHFAAIADARSRFLKPGGVQIPQQDRVWATLISDPDYYQSKYLSPWEDAPYGCILTANRQFVTNNWEKHRLHPAQLLVDPQVWATLDYTTKIESNVKATMTWTVDRWRGLSETESGTMHGIGMWFDTTLAEGIGFSNAPDKPECIYGNAFLPLSAPVDLGHGDLVTVTLQANLIGDDYIWSWQTKVIAGADPHHIKADYQQSTFFSIPRSAQALQTRSDSYIPSINESGKIDLIILNWMDAGKSLGDIAQHLNLQFPHRFPTVAKALSYVAELAQKYS
ncbi:class I SAM-dependent methyltransferase [Chamaesiphon sp. VAR_48_metabat_135_sub]|uniref:class I SAM-dependent methyltransferase n=1 Tax=Chamaesiphon sp. VAR_48_metabat_135_sub TaxID=2964699 RepID=UPI00286A8963|nr:class I SAM-dependent methyltransferase [Chamaesiphon sp. VAR_48_metabat_135_sub]